MKLRARFLEDAVVFESGKNKAESIEHVISSLRKLNATYSCNGDSWMSDELEQKFIRPIVNASYPGTLAALSLAALQITGRQVAPPVKLTLGLGALLFLLSAFSIFFYDIYPTRRWLWTSAAIAFLAGLTSSVFAVLALMLI